MAAQQRSSPTRADIGALEASARPSLRRHMLAMARGQGQGYVGQGLGIADVLAALYFHELRYDPAELDWPDRDRFLLSTGHYSIALWAALAEAGVIPLEELDDLRRRRQPAGDVDARHHARRRDDRRLARPRPRPGGRHGARPAARRTSDARVFVELSDGEMQEGSTWEAAMSAPHFGLDDLVALIDCNGIQADGPVVLDMEPVADKWRAFGWDTVEIDGNDMAAIVDALHGAREPQRQAEGDRAAHPARQGRADARDGARRRISSASTPASGTRFIAEFEQTARAADG